MVTKLNGILMQLVVLGTLKSTNNMEIQIIIANVIGINITSGIGFSTLLVSLKCKNIILII